jgi:hypothetical protein
LTKKSETFNEVSPLEAPLIEEAKIEPALSKVMTLVHQESESLHLE